MDLAGLTAKEKLVSTNFTWRDVKIWQVDTSRHRYALCVREYPIKTEMYYYRCGYKYFRRLHKRIRD